MIDEHEDRAELAPLWRKCRDCMSEEKVKAAGDKYMPRVGFHVRTEANKLRDPGDSDFNHFIAMSRYPEAFDATVELYAGKIETKPDTMNIGHAETEGFASDADGAGTGLSDLIHRNAIRELLTVGSIGVLVDNAGVSKVRKPVLRFYSAESILNFQVVGGRFQWVILKESVVTKTFKVDGFGVTSKQANQYRFMRIEKNQLLISLHDEKGEVLWSKSQLVNDKPLTSVPFFMWSVDGEGFAVPPLRKLANACLDYYRVRAMHRRGLSFGTMPIMWASGVEDTETFSPVPGQMSINTISEAAGRVDYAEYTGAIIGEVRQDLDAIQDQIIQLGATNLQSDRPSNVSGQSLQLMDSSDSCVLSKYVRRVSAGVRATLRYIAREWLGAGEDEAAAIEYEINTDFWVSEPDPAYLTALVAMAQSSYLRLEDIYHLLVRKDMIAPGADFDTWRRDVLKNMERNQDFQALQRVYSRPAQVEAE